MIQFRLLSMMVVLRADIAFPLIVLLAIAVPPCS